MLYDSHFRIYPVNKLVAVVEALGAEGIPVEHALKHTGVTPQELKSSLAKISIAQLLAAYRNALMFSRDPAFAVRLGQSVQVTTYGIYGYAMLSAPSQRAIIDTATKYHRLLLPTAHLWFREESEAKIGAWMIEPLVAMASEPRLYRFIVEVYLGTVATLNGDIFETRKMRREVRVTYPWSSEVPDYERHFQCPVRFEQEHNQLVLDTTWIDEPAKRSHALTFQAVETMCAEILDQMGSGTRIADGLQRILLESTGRFPTIEAASQQLKMSSRTLRRKLHAEGTSYGALVNDTRIRLAKRYLRETIMSIDDIAVRVGYSDGSSFRRAFQRSTSVTPTAYRDGAR